MNHIPKIFIISLKNSPRREFISKRLSDLKLNFEFFDAVYGKDLSEEKLKEIDFEFYPKHFSARKQMTLGEVGCAMSHIKLYEYIVENNIDNAIILEDDAIVSLYFKEIISDALNKISPKYEILFLDHGKAKIYPFPKNLVERYRLARYISPSKNSKRTIIRTTGYIITQAGAKRLLEYAYPIRMPSDFLTGALQMTHIRAYGIEPSCVFGGSHSEINEMEDRYN
ncbi:LPS biosynthesis glycosyltransferase [Glaesserella parasuis]|uniref:glycosyltransferase family 25 protein n=1 Tax=Glaesserella parasuis TaxID=738 RepID=UPI00094FC72F|nr:glycosyltransferase family 25 protein [Glaesserella parasuis]MDG6473623.1 glycosyltransferase family 25 protein [Glaesserella parasuis]MDG6771634.1 glycosyltransferase family 25 protein [Glaesserella parasuis]MDO9798897.1 glycosyltransferase family 25 protein [Glaesserella parasuis]MDO9831374.1 glycosyltransferase family 25 protein [Glaesserella parasuis]MDO9850868.1 glycosyltransferase family 25 protein [Glaesserella parasuis]